MEVERVDARQARNRFADLVGNVHSTGKVVIVERSGKPMLAVIPVELYERLVAQREARFAVLDRIRSQVPGISSEEVEADVTEAIAAVRAARVESSP